MHLKTIVIGLDGANWNLLEPWIERGDLPNLKYLRENGCWGVSECQLPAVTCPNWKCYSTGRNPGKLGVFWWQRIDRAQKKIVGYDSRSFKAPEIFDYLSNAGLKVGVLNMATTYPPKKINGFMVSGAPDAGYGGYTFPKSLEDLLKKEYDYQIYPKGHIASKKDIEDYFEDILHLIDLRFQVAKDKLSEVDFLHLSIFYINVLHHFLFSDSYVEEAWKCIDRNIGELIKEGHMIVLLSDHGTGEIDTTFFLNTWLEKEGYLKVNRSLLGNLSKVGITKQSVLRVTNKLGLTNWIKMLFPERVKRSLPSEDGTLAGTLITEDSVDLQRSKAIGIGQGLIYILVSDSSSEYESLRSEIINKLSKLKTEKGLKAAKNIYKREEIYSGKYLGRAPDIVFEEGNRVYTSTGIGKDKIFDVPEKWNAENNRDGIFLVYGAGIERGRKIEGIKILDIAPTILHVMGQPIPLDMDGRVLSEVFQAGGEFDRPVQMHGPKPSLDIKKLKRLKAEFQRY